MRRGYAMRKLERQHRKPAELLLVPMIDIFTVLVTFLLMTAVFSRTVVMELKLPAQSAAPVELPPGLVLEVVLRKSGLVVQDRKTGPLQGFPRLEGTVHYDLAGLSAFLQQVKAKYPDMTQATLLLEPDVPYDDMVQVMDTVRIVEQRRGNQIVQGELFPDVSLGDAPMDAAPAGAAPR
ncbi:MAG TPA: biopolymer transporter ExbD [Steroidobacteraceae bacterium]|nr:biopolymer transporter ExbD [Steroidobacteraceae bacterium]